MGLIPTPYNQPKIRLNLPRDMKRMLYSLKYNLKKKPIHQSFKFAISLDIVMLLKAERIIYGLPC